MRLPILPALLIAALAVNCSSNDHDANKNAGNASDPAHGEGSVDHDHGTTGSNANGTGTMEGSSATSNGRNATSSRTPAEERTATMTDMRGLRATLLADLEAVRARLNVGTMPKEQQVADKEMAAELAQGLERVDRALAAMDASTEATWADIRTVQTKEVEEVRAWMAGYKAKNASVSASK